VSGPSDAAAARAPDKKTAARIFREIASLLEIRGENPFKARAYENAARALEGTPLELGPLVAAGGHRTLPGIGVAIAAKIEELATTGRLAYHDELRASLPATILELAQVPGLGPKKIHALHKALGIATLDALEADVVLCEAMGPIVVPHYLAVKRFEWASYLAESGLGADDVRVSEWERATYLEHV